MVAANEVSTAAARSAGIAACAAVMATNAVSMPSHRAAAVTCTVSKVMRRPRGNAALMKCLAESCIACSRSWHSVEVAAPERFAKIVRFLRPVRDDGRRF